MTEVLVQLYVVGVVITGSAFFAVATRWRVDREPTQHPTVLSVTAGILWPVVLIGALQLGALALLVRRIRGHRKADEDYALAR